MQCIRIHATADENDGKPNGVRDRNRYNRRALVDDSGCHFKDLRHRAPVAAGALYAQRFFDLRSQFRTPNAVRRVQEKGLVRQLERLRWRSQPLEFVEVWLGVGIPGFDFWAPLATDVESPGNAFSTP